MTYNNGFPIGYQPTSLFQTPFNQPQFNQTAAPQSTSQNSNGVLWVQGESGAKSFLVAPNNSVMLMDSEGQFFYIKSADASGMPTLRKYSFSEVAMGGDVTRVPSTVDMSGYVTRDEMEKRLAQIQIPKAEPEVVSRPATTTTKKGASK